MLVFGYSLLLSAFMDKDSERVSVWFPTICQQLVCEGVPGGPPLHGWDNQHCDVDA